MINGCQAQALKLDELAGDNVLQESDAHWCTSGPLNWRCQPHIGSCEPNALQGNCSASHEVTTASTGGTPDPQPSARRNLNHKKLATVRGTRSSGYTVPRTTKTGRSPD